MATFDGIASSHTEVVMTAMDHNRPDTSEIESFLLGLQETICAGLEESDGEARFQRAEMARPGGGQSRPWVLSDGPVLERAAVNFTHTLGVEMPAAASARRPELAGRHYEAVSISLIVHPRNPYAPTSHANFRFFSTRNDGESEPIWWFGGGFDLTPFYGFEEDAVHWHRVAHAACAPHGDDVYREMKATCDEYFHLDHRGEQRGIGGLFFDDLCAGGYARCSALWRDIAEAYLPAYKPILDRRKATPHGEHERDFQLYRRGRYVEFNLLYDRGTKFGLQAGARTESVLASMPPLVAWRYDWSPTPGSEEARLYEDFLQPQDWLARGKLE
jgi:coproporphyrinogen III oxidase